MTILPNFIKLRKIEKVYKVMIGGDQTAWLSELGNVRDYLRISLEELGAIVKV